MKSLITTSFFKKTIALLGLCFFAVNSLMAQMLCNAQFTHQAGNTVNSVHFTSTPNSAILTTYSWSFGDGGNSVDANPTHTYAPGNYLACLTVTLPSSNGTILCTATFCDSVHVGTTTVNCNAHFTHVLASNTSNLVYFTSSTNPAGTTYSWTFGDGGTSTNPNPTHTYALGNYLACLTVAYGNPGGITCTSSFCDSVHVNPVVVNCNAHFTFQHAGTNGALFTSASNPAGTMYSWTLGDGSTASSATPTHTYANGHYLVCLTVTVPSASGSILCTSTFCDSIHIGPTTVNCNAHFTHQNSTSSNNVYFTSPANTTGTTYSWTFGDGSTSTDPNPVHLYAPGNYLACLTVAYGNPGGVNCTSTFCDSVHVNPITVNCNAHFTFQHVGTNGALFTAASNPAGTIYSWTLGDGTLSSSATPTHTYANGNYLVCLTVTVPSVSGAILCTSTFCDSIHIGTTTVNCNANFTHQNSTSSNNVYFISPANPAGTTYSWTFGDGGTSTNPNPVHLYSPGNYLACLTVNAVSANGTILCTSTHCDSVHVHNTTVNCSAQFTHQMSTGSVGEHFTSAANPAGTTYSWTFGDGGTSVDPNPTHLYAPGNYLACLTVNVVSPAGNILCTSMHCDSIHIGNNVPNCNAGFSYQHLSATLTYSFTNLSSSNATGYFWHFGDATTSIMMNPVHHYMVAGSYQVCLTMLDTIHHCSRTDCKMITASLAMSPVALSANKIEGSVNENSDAMMVSVYPNPASENATIHIENANSVVSFKLFDSTGRLALQKNNLSSGDFQLNNSGFAAGMYYYQVTGDNNKLVSGKLMIQK